MLGAEGDHVPHREQHQEHVHVDVGDDSRTRYRGVMGEVVGAQQSLLLAGHGDE